MINEIKGVVYNYHIKSVIKRSKQSKKEENAGGFSSFYACPPYYRDNSILPQGAYTKIIKAGFLKKICYD